MEDTGSKKVEQPEDDDDFYEDAGNEVTHTNEEKKDESDDEYVPDLQTLKDFHKKQRNATSVAS